VLLAGQEEDGSAAGAEERRRHNSDGLFGTRLAGFRCRPPGLPNHDRGGSGEETACISTMEAARSGAVGAWSRSQRWRRTIVGGGEVSREGVRGVEVQVPVVGFQICRRVEAGSGRKADRRRLRGEGDCGRRGNVAESPNII
jgi:hypothetical protein